MPTPRRWYILAPLITGAGCALAMACVAVVGSLPPSPLAWAGLGLGAGAATGMVVAISAIPQERRAWYDWQLRDTSIFTPPPGEPTEPQPDERELIYTPKGPALMDRGRNTMTMLKGWRKGRAPASVAAFNQLTEVVGRIDVTTRENPNAVDRMDLSEGMYRLARYGAASKSTAESEWTGSDKPFSLPEYRALRDWMMTKGHAQWRGKGNTQGWEYTPGGLACLRWMNRQPAPPARTHGAGL